MNITGLTERFEFYAINHILIKHEPDSEKGKAFFCLDIQDIAASIKSQIKFPALFLQLPEVEKDGENDSVIEAFEGSFVIIDKCPDKATALQKTATLDNCKKLCDDIYKRMLFDSDEYFDSAKIKTAEGSFGPIARGMVGWGVNFGFEQGFDAENNPNMWEDLA